MYGYSRQPINTNSFLRSKSIDHARYFRENNTKVTSMIQSRLEKLQHERDLLYNSQNMRNTPQPANVSNLYSYKNFSQLGHQIMNPYFYSYRFLDPIYYPLQLPGTGTPVTPPRTEMGAPTDEDEDDCCGGGGMKASELLVILKAMGKIPKDTNLNIYELMKNEKKNNS